jgi:hypothetical protein
MSFHSGAILISVHIALTQVAAGPVLEKGLKADRPWAFGGSAKWVD